MSHFCCSLAKNDPDGNKNNHPDSLPMRIYIGTSPFSLMGNQTVHEESFKYKYKLP